MKHISLPERVGWDDHECLSIFARFLLVGSCCDLFPRAPQQSLLLEFSSLKNKHTQTTTTSKTTGSLLDSFLRFICKETKNNLRVLFSCQLGEKLPHTGWSLKGFLQAPKLLWQVTVGRKDHSRAIPDVRRYLADCVYLMDETGGILGSLENPHLFSCT